MSISTTDQSSRQHIIQLTSYLTKAELFVIRCSINQATCLSNVKYIFVIMDSIHAAKRIFDLSFYPYQIYLIVISGKLREFFQKDSNNSIEFLELSQ